MRREFPEISSDRHFQELNELLITVDSVSAEGCNVELSLETPEAAQRFFHLMGLIPNLDELGDSYDS